MYAAFTVPMAVVALHPVLCKATAIRIEVRE